MHSVYWTHLLLFLNTSNAIYIKTKALLPRTQVALADFGYSYQALWFSPSADFGYSYQALWFSPSADFGYSYQALWFSPSVDFGYSYQAFWFSPSQKLLNYFAFQSFNFENLQKFRNQESAKFIKHFLTLLYLLLFLRYKSDFRVHFLRSLCSCNSV